LSDHIFSASPSSLASILAHSIPLCRLIFFSNRPLSVLSSCSPSSSESSCFCFVLFAIMITSWYSSRYKKNVRVTTETRRWFLVNPHHRGLFPQGSLAYIFQSWRRGFLLVWQTRNKGDSLFVVRVSRTQTLS
jgi:hypothetical protein